MEADGDYEEGGRKEERRKVVGLGSLSWTEVDLCTSKTKHTNCFT